MEENQIPMPTGLTPAPTPRQETVEPQPVPDNTTESASETTGQPEEQETDEEIRDEQPGGYSLLDVDPPLLVSCSALLGVSLPFMNIILPFILWILWRDKDDRINQAGIAVLNVQLTAFMWIILSGLTIGIWIGLLLLPLAILGWACATIVQVLKMKANDYDWLPPGTIPFIRAI